MKVYLRSLALACVIFISSVPAVSAGGYYLVDKDGKVLNAEPGQPVEIGSENSGAVFTGRGGEKVFEAEWNASGETLTIKGQDVYLRIHGNGKIEKLTTMQEGKSDQAPLLIQPVIPIFPGQRP